MAINNLAPLRTAISIEAAKQLRDTQLLIDESHRVRPRYFDGKFLAARDLTRDQAYFLARQAGYARALGPGVVDGLLVAAGDTPSQIKVGAGFGYTPGGELVSLNGAVRVSLTQLFRLQTLAVQLGTLGGGISKARPPLRNRTGVFVLGLRALEFSANPVGAYPTSLDGPRQVEEGDIVEATALTLTYFTDASRDQRDTLRGQLARDTFVTGQLPPLPAELLPLALLEIAGDNVRWIDMHLARRAAGQAHADVLGFGFAPRLLREAHLAQYSQQLQELTTRGLSARPTANQYFSALPPAGPMPASAVATGDFSQSWFPPGIDADLALVPEDEIAALVEESLVLPPIDLGAGADALASTAVAILVPVPRHALARTAARLQQRIERATTVPSVRLATKRLPLDAMRLLEARRLPGLTAAAAATAAAHGGVDAVWAELLSQQANAGGQLWYTRRRNLALRPEIAGTVVAVVAAQDNTDNVIRARFTADLATRLDRVLAASTNTTRAEVSKLLASDRLASPVLAQATLAALEAKQKEATDASPTGQINAADVAAVAETFTAPGVGEGLARLVAEKPELVATPEAITKLATSDRLLELDRTLATANTFEATRIATALKVPGGNLRLNLDNVLMPR